MDAKKENIALWLSVISLLMSGITLMFLWNSQRFGKLLEDAKSGFIKLMPKSKKETGDRV